jgi:CheY-like chemotaxis protein
MSTIFLVQGPSADGWIAGLTAVAGALGTFVWPATVVVVLAMFRDPLRGFLTNLQNATVKAGGAEVTLTARAEAAVVAATVDKSGSGATRPDDIERAIRSTRATTTALPPSGLLGRTALWVDDKPDNNRHEREALTALGLGITTCTSSDQALGLLATRSFDVVISDLSRPEGRRAGLDLLAALRKTGNQVPYIVYAGSASASDVADATSTGAFGYTADPSTLLRLVTSAVAARPT